MSVRWHDVVENFAVLSTNGPADWKHRIADFHDMLEHIHGQTGGNRSATATWVDAHEGLQYCSSDKYEPLDVRTLQHHLRSTPAESVLAEFDRLAEHHPDDPVAYTYAGETLIWLGEYATSESYFRRAINGRYHTIWCWIGLGAARGLQGQLEEGLRIFAEGEKVTGFEGPSVFVYRGEFYRRLGQLQQAEEALTRAVQHKPQRLSAWINRVLLDFELGNPRPVEALALALKQKNPSLWCDAVDEASRTVDGNPENEDVLESMLTLMRGNRSSQILTYILPDGTLRGARWSKEDVPHHLRALYDVQ